MAKKIVDPKTSELYSKLGKEKREEVNKLKILISRWPPKALGLDFIEWVNKEIDYQEIFVSYSLIDASEQEILEYAIKQEESISSFFSDLKKYFPKYSWKAIQIESIILTVQDNRDQLDQRLAQLNE